MLTRMRSWLLAPVDVAWLVAFRVVFGLLVAVSLERFVTYGWVDEFLVGPRFHFKYWGFAWVEPLQRDAMFGLFYGLIGLAFCVAAGLCFRLAALGLALGFSYLQLIDVSTYLNHYYLASLLAWLLAVSPAARHGSLDAWWRGRRARRASASVSASGTAAAPMDTTAPDTGPPSAEVARIWLLLFRVQVGVVYFFAAIAKLQPDWLLDAEPLGIWLNQSTSLPILGPILTWPGAAWVFAWCGFCFDLTIVGWLSWSKSRPYAYAVVLVFHTVTRLLFDIGMFPMIMSAAALVFFSPSWPRRLLRLSKVPQTERSALLVERAAAEPERLPARTSRPWLEGSPRLRDAALALGVAYCALQLLLPLRFLAYPGNVLWHEQGMRFSWRVMVRAKGGAVTFALRDPSTGTTQEIEPHVFLTPFQENEMAGQPDLILQGAHYLAAEFARNRGHRVEVYARSRATLNGRRAAPFIDPGVDLTQVRDGLAPYGWVLPAPDTRAPHVRPVL
ncbi:MAG TPA: HTTM domain-containing protein [Polyangiaceae bacterium]|nr:HTTM domain-containing protein [Polyangiaceae bacterium]